MMKNTARGMRFGFDEGVTFVVLVVSCDDDSPSGVSFNNAVSELNNRFVDEDD
jgi:hypothetical protein